MLDKTLNRCLEEVSITKKDEKSSGLIFEHTNEQFVDSKLNATQMTTIYLRDYLSKNYENGKCTKSTIDSNRGMISSFFTWMEDEEYIIKNPMRRIHKIKLTRLLKKHILMKIWSYLEIMLQILEI